MGTLLSPCFNAFGDLRKKRRNDEVVVKSVGFFVCLNRRGHSLGTPVVTETEDISIGTKMSFGKRTCPQIPWSFLSLKVVVVVERWVFLLGSSEMKFRLDMTSCSNYSYPSLFL